MRSGGGGAQFIKRRIFYDFRGEALALILKGCSGFSRFSGCSGSPNVPLAVVPYRPRRGRIKEVCKRTTSLGAKRLRDVVRRHFERSEDGRQ